jgi:hypothetical protein
MFRKCLARSCLKRVRAVWLSSPHTASDRKSAALQVSLGNACLSRAHDACCILLLLLHFVWVATTKLAASNLENVNIVLR